VSDSGINSMFFTALLGIALWTSLAVGSDLLSDPTRPPAAIGAPPDSATEIARASLDLRAVIYAEGRRVAIINGQRVRENDRVGSALVVAIEPDRVRLRRGSDTIVLEVVRGDVKGTPGWSPEEREPAEGRDRRAGEARAETDPPTRRARPSVREGTPE